MPFAMKIQPIDSQTAEESFFYSEPVKPVVKSRLKGLFERQFLNNSAAEKAGFVVEEPPPLHFSKDNCNGGGSADFEPSSVCLAKMVQNFIEENNEKQQSSAVRCGRSRCNGFNGSCSDSSEDELDSYFGDTNLASSGETYEILKSLVPCTSVYEKNLLTDTAKIVEKNKICKRRDDNCRKIVTDGLLALGYDASICKSHWDKSPAYPAGDYEYVDVIIQGERLIIDIDFRSEFEIARSTKTYKLVLQRLPYIFVGKADRLQKIIGILSEAAKQSLKKRGMHIPPWRKADYIEAKWLSPHLREIKNNRPLGLTESEFEISHGENNNSVDDGELGESMFVLSESSEEEKKVWNPPEVKPRSLQIDAKIVTGLASLIEDHQPLIFFFLNNGHHHINPLLVFM
ncbi:uncharacterized protein LOC123222651 [Mangifera indica]|uniref:uncharacterized protein LOC123222651 n=1 Tax=Mangifera indica TaxID=29780 RepID=UPI001CFC4632|nr:uncharacterized protein LOC123222651 [Mangifera indica]XP_044501464.1 uncharacterized protein LOC123222651 [Mangifera indica]